ncbi:MAG: DUF1501 domain-containing protein [Acidimicrobiales bacterium]
MTSLSRRQFIAGATGIGMAGAATVAVATHPLRHPAARALSKAQAAPVLKAGGTLVLVALYGGNDGENTVIPYSDPAYLAGRPDLGYRPDEVIALDHELGLHPNLPGLKSLWDAKQLAIVRGVGYPSPSHSHFRGMDIWQSAVPETDEVTGWVGRWLDTAGGKDPLLTLSLGPTLPKLVSGAKTAGSSVPTGAATLPGGGRLDAAFAAVESSRPSGLAARIAQSGTDLLTVLHSVKDVLAVQPDTSLEAAPPDKQAKPARNGLASQLDLVARLIKGGLPTRVYVVSMGGFDTHVTEKQNHANLMGELDAGISGFVKALAADPKGKDVVLMTFSEFGRRVAQNASGGTDHGTAAPLFVAGPTVKGGFYGDQPSLTALDQGDLRYTTDFRSVYATVADRVLGIDPKSVLAGKTFPTLAFV